MIETLEISTEALTALSPLDNSPANLISTSLEQHKNLIDESETIVSVFGHFNQTFVTLRYAEEGQRTEWYILSWQEFVNLGVTFSSFSLN